MEIGEEGPVGRDAGCYYRSAGLDCGDGKGSEEIPARIVTLQRLHNR